MKNWKDNLKKLSGNLTTNASMPTGLRKVLLQEDLSLKNKILLEEKSFSQLKGLLGEIPGMNILAGLQNLKKQNCLTVYRAVRFPTYKRMHEIVTTSGFAIGNYEQERIEKLYKDKNYFKKRT